MTEKKRLILVNGSVHKFAFSELSHVYKYLCAIKEGFLLTRSIIGIAEAGYIPGAMYTISTWYTSAELTKRVTIFFFGMFGGTAMFPLVGAALLKQEGKGGPFGWQWIFLGNLNVIHANVNLC